MFSLENPASDAKVRAGRRAAANGSTPLTTTALGKESAMADRADSAAGSCPSIPNMGHHDSEINDNWQHVSQPVNRVLAQVLEAMAQRRREDMDAARKARGGDHG